MATPADLPNHRPDPDAATFDDGLGVRRIERDDTSGDLVEKLYVSAMLSKHAAALRERATRLANFRHPRYPRVRGVEVSDDHKVVAVVSDLVEGVRLSQLIALSEQGRLGIDVHAAIQLGREVLPALATLHGSRDVTHGTLGAERLILTKLGRVMVTDHALGAAIEKLQYPRPRLWKDYRIAMPPAAGLPRFDARADVAQVAIVMLELILGRSLTLHDFPDGIKKLIGSVTERLGSHAQRPMSPSLRAWFEQALPVDARKPLATALDAQIALEEVIKRERAYAADLGVLRHLATRAIEFVPARVPAAEPPSAESATAALRLVPPGAAAQSEPAAPRRRATPRKAAAARRPTPEEEEAEEIAFLERELARLAAEEQAGPAAPIEAVAPPVTLADLSPDPLAFGGPLGEALVEVLSETPRFVASTEAPLTFDVPESFAVSADAGPEVQGPLVEIVCALPIDEAPTWCLTPFEPAGEPELQELLDVVAVVVDHQTLWLDFESMHVSRQVPATTAQSAAVLALAAPARARSVGHLVAGAAAPVPMAVCTTIGTIADAARRYRGFEPAHAPFVRARDIAEPSAPWMLAARSIIADVAALAAVPVAAARPRATRLARALTVLPFVPAAWRRPARAVAALAADTLAARMAAQAEYAAGDEAIDYRDVDADGAEPFARAAVVLTSDAFRRLSIPVEEPVEVPVEEPVVTRAAAEAELAVAADPVSEPFVEAPETPAGSPFACVDGSPIAELATTTSEYDLPVAAAASADSAVVEAVEPETSSQAEGIVADVEAVTAVASIAPIVEAPPSTIDEAPVAALSADLASVAPAMDAAPAPIVAAPDEPAVAISDATLAIDDESCALDALQLTAEDAEPVIVEPASRQVEGLDAVAETDADGSPDANAHVLDESDPEIAALLRELEALEAVEAADAAAVRDVAVPPVPAPVDEPALASAPAPAPVPQRVVEPPVVAAPQATIEAAPVVLVAVAPVEVMPPPAPVVAPVACDVPAAPSAAIPLDDVQPEASRKQKRIRGGARKKAKRDAVSSEPAAVVRIVEAAAPVPERVVVQVESRPVAPPAPPVAAATARIVPVPPPPPRSYAPWEVPETSASIGGAATPATAHPSDVARSGLRSSFMDAPMPAVVVAPAPAPQPVAVPPPPVAPIPAAIAHVVPMPVFEAPSFATSEHEVLSAAASIFAEDEAEPVVSRTRAHRLPVRFDTRKINWRRTLAASLLLMLLESAGFAAVYWFTQPKDVGYLNVRSSVDGLEVRINGKAAGKTPLAVELPAGRHTIEMSGFGLSKVLPVEIASGVQTTQMVKWPRGQKVGTLQVASTPPGARVIIDGEMRGVTPVTIEGLSDGGHTLVLESDAGRVRQGVRVVANESTSVTVGIFAGWLNVFAPVQVRVFEDGKLLGTSEDGKLLLPPGEHRLELINPQLGLRQQRTVEVTPGNTTTLSMDAPDGSVVIDAPEGTEVWIDGQQRGIAPMAPLNTAVGTREVILRHPQIGQRRFTVQVGVKAPARAEFFTP